MSDDIIKEVIKVDKKVVGELTIKFASDSGEGIQLTGQKFAELASNALIKGNNKNTFTSKMLAEKLAGKGEEILWN